MYKFLDKCWCQWTFFQLDCFQPWLPLSFGHLDRQCIGMTQMLLTCITFVWAFALTNDSTSGALELSAQTLWQPRHLLLDSKYAAWNHCFHLVQVFGILQLLLLGIQLIAFLLWYSLTGVLPLVHTHMQLLCQYENCPMHKTLAIHLSCSALAQWVVLLWFITVRTFCSEGTTG